MGAKMMPMEKKRGRTVFGVRIGLIRGQRCAFASCGSFAHPQRLTAMPSAAAVETQCLLVDTAISYMSRTLRRLRQFPLQPISSRVRFINPQERARGEWYRCCRG